MYVGIYETLVSLKFDMGRIDSRGVLEDRLGLSGIGL